MHTKTHSRPVAYAQRMGELNGMPGPEFANGFALLAAEEKIARVWLDCHKLIAMGGFQVGV